MVFTINNGIVYYPNVRNLMNQIYRINSIHPDINPIVILDNNICSRVSMSEIKLQIKDIEKPNISFLPGVLEKNNSVSYLEEEWNAKRNQLLLEYPGADCYLYSNVEFPFSAYVSLIKTLEIKAERLSILRTIRESKSLKSLSDKKIYIEHILNTHTQIDMLAILFLAHVGKNEELKNALQGVLKANNTSNKNALLDLYYLELLEISPSIVLLTSDKHLAGLSKLLLKHREFYEDNIFHKVSHSYEKFQFEPELRDFFKDQLIKRGLLLIDYEEHFTLTHNNQLIDIIITSRKDSANCILKRHCNICSNSKDALISLLTNYKLEATENTEGLTDLTIKLIQTK